MQNTAWVCHYVCVYEGATGVSLPPCYRTCVRPNTRSWWLIASIVCSLSASDPLCRCIRGFGGLSLWFCCYSYIVRANEKQAVFTGKQQRDGVAVLAFIVAGLFGPHGDEDGNGAFAPEQQAERETAAAAAEAAGYEADGDDEAAKVGKNFSFDWTAYHNEWGDTPVHVAVTSMFAEYAVLYARITGRKTSAVPPPMTMTEGLAIGEHATRFVNKFVTPTLGHIASVKIHKLLCHVSDAIKWHGNVQNCDTATNESEHKADKAHYCRTNKDVRTFTRQLVRHPHGARRILASHAEADQVANAAWKAERASRAAQVGGQGREQRDGALAATSAAASAGGGAVQAGGGAAAAAATTAAEGARKQMRRMYNVGKVSVAVLATRPDLANIGALLNMAGQRQVRVTTRTPVLARFECGTRVVQHVRAAENYLGAPWFDAVFYTPNGDETRLCVGEVRAIIRGPKGDAVVLIPMDPVPAEPLCPFAARGCVRLKWRIAENETDLTLRLVPGGNVQRLAFVVPDFADLAVRHGVDADFPAMDSSLQERVDMRFFLNVFSPWDVR